jgi:SAM-dependent methyltransferase
LTHQSSQYEFAWSQTVIGRYVNACEQNLYDDVVVDLFGFNALQMGGYADFLQQSRVANRFKASQLPCNTSSEILHHLYCDDDFLPFAEMSIDVLLLPRRLEFSVRPHQTLREAFRVLVPDGYVIITGFNPVSAWGLKTFFKRFCTEKAYPWNGRMIRLTRLKDWLSVLGFEVQDCGYLAHVPPFERASWHLRFKWMDKVVAKYLNALGGVYYVVAKKRVVELLPIRPKWQAQGLKAVLVGQKNKNIKTKHHKKYD